MFGFNVKIILIIIASVVILSVGYMVVFKTVTPVSESPTEGSTIELRSVATRVRADLRSIIVALDFPSIDEKCIAPTISIEVGKPIVCGPSTYLREVPGPYLGFSYNFPKTVEIATVRDYVFSAEGFKDGGTLICSDGRCYCEQEGLCQY